LLVRQLAAQLPVVSDSRFTPLVVFYEAHSSRNLGSASAKTYPRNSVARHNGEHEL